MRARVFCADEIDQPPEVAAAAMLLQSPQVRRAAAGALSMASRAQRALSQRGLVSLPLRLLTRERPGAGDCSRRAELRPRPSRAEHGVPARPASADWSSGGRRGELAPPAGAASTHVIACMLGMAGIFRYISHLRGRRHLSVASFSWWINFSLSPHGGPYLMLPTRAHVN